MNTLNHPSVLLSQHQNNALTLEKVMNFDLSEVREYVSERYPAIDVNKAVTQYRYFIYLIVATGKNVPVPSDEVDLIWHAAILHTQDYFCFCQEVAGYFIHHQPKNFTRQQKSQMFEELFLLSLKHFGRMVFDFPFAPGCLIPSCEPVGI